MHAPGHRRTPCVAAVDAEVLHHDEGDALGLDLHDGQLVAAGGIRVQQGVSELVGESLCALERCQRRVDDDLAGCPRPRAVGAF